MEIFRRCFIYGKKNGQPPKDYDESNLNQPYYDIDSHYGAEIPGGIANGYSEEELLTFYESLKGYCTYLFNKSHSSSYAVVTLATMLLKAKYPAQFLSATLTMSESQEDVDKYISVAKKEYNCSVKPIDINKSIYDFKAENDNIYCGFTAVKGLGSLCIDEILAKRPFSGLEDFLNKVPKKAANKKSVIALIKSGAFDFENKNRNELINKFYDLRKEDEEKLVTDIDLTECYITYEKEILGSAITYESWYDKLNDKESFREKIFDFESLNVRKDKRGNDMGFFKLKLYGTEIDALMFSSNFRKIKFNLPAYKVSVSGKKDNNKIIIDSICILNETEAIDDFLSFI